MGVTLSYSPIKKKAFKTEIGHRSDLIREIQKNTHNSMVNKGTALDYLKAGDFPEFWTEVEELVKKYGSILITEDW